MYCKSFTLCLLSSALLLGSTVNGHRHATERHEGNSLCRGLSDKSGTLMVDCSWQGLMSVPATSSGQLVHTLDLSHNFLHKLCNDSFQSYPKLTQLILSSDSITSIEVNTFSSVRALRKVDLSYNSLTSIHPNIFIYNTNLESLSLQGNPLQPLVSRTPLLIATSLQSLDLSYCHILELSAKSLSQLPKLKILNLSNNSLKQLPVNSMSALSSLQLVGNPWQCDCCFHALLMWVSANPMMDVDIANDNTVQCWQGNDLRILTTKQEQDSICKEVMGCPISQKIRPELAVVSNNKSENTHSKKEGPEFEIETLLDDISSYDGLDEDSSLSFPAFNKDDDKWIYDDEYLDVFSSDIEDSEEMDRDSTSLLSAEIHSLDHQNDMNIDLNISVNIGENHIEVSGVGEVKDSTIKLPSLSYGFIPEDVEDSYYDYEFYGEYQDSGELCKDKIPPSSAETTNLKPKDDNVFADVTYIVKNSDLQESDTKHQTTTSFSSQNNDSVVDGNVTDSSSLRISNLNLTDSDKDILNNSRDFEYKCIFCADNAVISPQTPRLHENEYEFTETSIVFENINTEGTVIDDETADYTIRFPSVYDDFNSEDDSHLSVIRPDDLNLVEVANNEILLSATDFPDLIKEDNFDIDKLINSILKGFYSEADDQEHTAVMNQISDKSPNRINLKMFIFIKFLILAGMVSVVVFLLVVTIYCIGSVCLTPVLSRQVIVYKRMEKCASKHDLQNV